VSTQAITAALEALEAGDQREAVAILLSALEDGPERTRGDACKCSVCGQGFEWPGQRDAHVARVHGFGFEEAA
jgi:hypothetical protein